ncbi:hypothetical protein ACFB49_23640 [Sphingomonas sp. DBB INV C78]|uniref:hypothetical protein n=1 Tax=Sphingomonas sp. DBB INV C78 TaxID=3349434 RepID=UPI0036D2AEE5
MIEAVLVVFTNARPGREADFDDWYTHIHLRDALRFRGSVTAQRFRWSAVQADPSSSGFGWDYLALYDVFDAERFTREHIENALTTRMMVTDAIAADALNDFHYYPLAFRDNDPETPHQGGVVLELLNPVAGSEAAFRQWYQDQHMPERLRRPGVHSAAFLMFRPHGQLVETLPDHSHVGIYRVDDMHGLDGWREQLDEAGAGLVDPARCRVTCWDPITPRITEDQVFFTDADALAAEERARSRMGDKVLTDRGSELRTH